MLVPGKNAGRATGGASALREDRAHTAASSPTISAAPAALKAALAKGDTWASTMPCSHGSNMPPMLPMAATTLAALPGP